MFRRKLLQVSSNPKLQKVQSPSNSSIWTENSSYDVLWTGIFSLDDFVQIVLHNKQSRVADVLLVSDTQNDGVASIALGAVPSGEYQVRVVLLSGDGLFISSDLFKIRTEQSKGFLGKVPLGVASCVLYSCLGIIFIVLLTMINKIRKRLAKNIIAATEDAISMANTAAKRLPGELRSPVKPGVRSPGKPTSPNRPSNPTFPTAVVKKMANNSSSPPDDLPNWGTPLHNGINTPPKLFEQRSNKDVSFTKDVNCHVSFTGDMNSESIDSLEAGNPSDDKDSKFTNEIKTPFSSSAAGSFRKNKKFVVLSTKDSVEQNT